MPAPAGHGALHPARWQQRLLIAVAWAVAATGVAWLALHHGRGDEALPHPAEAWLIRLHGAAAFAALFAAGVLAAQHVPSGWRASHRPRHASARPSGLLALGAWAAAVASGYALYYLVPEAWRGALGWAHAACGLLAVACGLWHGQRRRRRRAMADAHFS